MKPNRPCVYQRTLVQFKGRLRSATACNEGTIMSNHQNQDMFTLAVKAAELAYAVPQVMAQRITRMAIAGPLPSARDQKEFHTMSSEKTAAFVESWTAMAAQTLRVNQALSMTFLRAFWSPFYGISTTATTLVTQLQSAAFGILEKGLAPVHGKAVANAKRLARTRFVTPRQGLR